MPKIVGGAATSIDRVPWQLSIRVNGVHKCGATIISEKSALSGAHCYRPNVEELDTFTVLAGSTLRLGDGGSFIIGVDKFIQHPNYNNATMENGILLYFCEIISTKYLSREQR